MKKLIIMLVCLSSLSFGEGFRFYNKNLITNSKATVLGAKDSKIIRIEFNEFISSFDYKTLTVEEDNGNVYTFDEVNISDSDISIYQTLNRYDFSRIIKLFKKSNELKFFINDKMGMEHSVKIDCKGFTKAYNQMKR